ncbi:hypothetical protein [Mycobacterium sp. NPDC006124]|uniref:hypothetical protein n=1 Tax=Mycobacterium sp. NPDC006124 TaxID=3156729 RepID=UPI0033A1BC46
MTASLLRERSAMSIQDEAAPGSGPSVYTPALIGWCSVASGVAAMVPLPSGLRAIFLALFVLFGPGTAVVMRLSLPKAAVIAAVPVIGLAVVSGATTVLAWFHQSAAPILHLALLVLVTIAMLRRPAETALPRPTAAGARRLALDLVADVRASAREGPALLLAVAIAAWLAALPGLRHVPYSQFGLLFVGTGPAIAICTVVALGAFVLALRRDSLTSAGLAIVAVIAVQRLTVTLVTDVPIYNWAYKHLGVVDYIQRFHDLPGGSDIYGLWPSFFTTFAWFGEVSGMEPIVVAHVFAPVIHALIAVEVVSIAKLLGLNSKVALTAAMICELVNWVGQDYFSPQAVAFVMALGIVALLIASKSHRVAGLLSIPLFAALVPLHQLTPYWLCGVATVLAVAGRVRPRWLPIPFIGLLVAYLMPRLAIVAPYGIFSFNPVANAQSNVEFEGSFGKFFTSLACRSLSAAVVLLALVCAILWWRQRKPCLIAAVMAFSSFALLAGQSYGGEAIFRVYLYAIPGCAILIAPLLLQAIMFRSKRAVLQRAVGAGVMTLMGLATLAGLQGYYGLWPIVLEHRSQIALGDELMAQAQAPIKVMSLYPGGGLPTRSTADYFRFTEQDKDFDQAIPALPTDFLRNFPNANQLQDISASAASFPGETYIVFDQQANLALDYYGYLPPGSITTFEDQLRNSGSWRVYRTNDVTTIFEFIRGR